MSQGACILPQGEQYRGDAVSPKRTGTAVNAAERKRVMDEDEIIGFEALYNSMRKCQKGVLWKGSVAHFVLNDMEELYKLSRQLKDGTYKARPVVKFTITKPKKREIISICFRDRVYQRSLNDNALYPAMTRSFINDNWACQSGKGTDYARERVKVFLHQMYRKHGTDFYIFQADIHGYYPNMRHDVTNQMIRERARPEIAERAVEVLDSQYAGNVGYNPGSQMVQIAGISALDKIDHRMKEVLRVEKYGRYMDDTLMMDTSKEKLHRCKTEYERMLKEIGLEFNPKKTRIFPVKCGFTFLGFKFVLTDTGKVLMFVSPEKVKETRQILRKLVKLYRKGRMTRKDVDRCYYDGMRKHLCKGDSTKLIERTDKYYKRLWEQKGEEHVF